MKPSISRTESFVFLMPVCMIMIVGFVAPLGFIFYNSLTINGSFTTQGFETLAKSALFQRVFWTTLEISLVAAIVSLLVGYPVALHISRQPPSLRSLYLLMVLMPFWTSILVKSFVFTVILGNSGLINTALQSLGLPQFEMIFNRFGVIVGTTNFLIPFAVLPILANLLSQDQNLRKAAEVMGASPLRIFWKITFPLSTSGVLAAFIITFVLSLGFFATPALLGGRQDMMMSNLIDFYTRTILNWNMASAIAVVLLFTSAALLLLLSRVQGKEKLA